MITVIAYIFSPPYRFSSKTKSALCAKADLNRGAWGDVNNIIIGMDMCVMFILESILAMFNVHKTIEETDYYKPIINLVRNSVKRIKTICDEKIKILGVPGIVI